MNLSAVKEQHYIDLYQKQENYLDDDTGSYNITCMQLSSLEELL